MRLTEHLRKTYPSSNAVIVAFVENAPWLTATDVSVVDAIASHLPEIPPAVATKHLINKYQGVDDGLWAVMASSTVMRAGSVTMGWIINELVGIDGVVLPGMDVSLDTRCDSLTLLSSNTDGWGLVTAPSQPLWNLEKIYIDDVPGLRCMFNTGYRCDAKHCATMHNTVGTPDAEWEYILDTLIASVPTNGNETILCSIDAFKAIKKHCKHRLTITRDKNEYDTLRVDVLHWDSGARIMWDYEASYWLRKNKDGNIVRSVGLFSRAIEDTYIATKRTPTK